MKVKNQYMHLLHGKYVMTLVFSIASLLSASAQNFELDLSTGIHLSQSKFHHSSNVDTDGESFDNSGSQYILGVTGTLKNNLKLRTEIGFVNTNSFLNISYSFDEGSGTTNRILLGWLNHQRMYLGILPEYRIKKKNFT